MRRSSRSALWLCLLLTALGASACNRWRPQQANDVALSADPVATYAVVLGTLSEHKYSLVDQDAAAHTVRVRAHSGTRSEVSVILLSVDNGGVHLSATGALVHPDGTTHHSLNAELGLLRRQLEKNLASNGHAPAPASNTGSLPPAPSAPPGSLPLAWSEPAYDPSVWGHGNFTCLPVKLADEEQGQLTLKLSTGENADVLLSLAHAPELCRSAAECKLPGGCPALGMADAARVSRLASRLSKHEIGPLATLFSRGQPVATIDLSKHGSIAQALAEKH